MRTKSFFCTLAVLVGLICGTATAAQAQDATIFGQVTDGSGAVLPGVTVTVASPALLVKQVVVVSDANGEFRVTPLPIGLYTVEFELAGFQTLRRDEVRLTVGFQARLDTALQLGAVSETVTVSGQSPVVDVRTTSTGTELTRELLESVPTGRNGINSVLMMAVGARPVMDFGTLGAIDPYFKAFGRQHKAWTLVEGVSSSPPVAGTAVTQNFVNYDAIEEASVKTLGASAEGPTSGIQTTIVYKSGGNEFHGGGAINEFASWMQGNNIDDRLRSQGITAPQGVDEKWDRGGDLGGRLLRDRLWFYGSARKRHEATAYIAAYKPDGSPALNVTDHNFLIGKLTAQLTQSQKLIGLNQWFRRTTLGGNSFTRFLDYDSIGLHSFDVWVRKGEYQYAKGNMFLSAQSGLWYSAPPEPFPCLSPNPTTMDQVTGRQTGCEEMPGGGGSAIWRGRYDQRATLSWFKSGWAGNHDFKTGFSYANARNVRQTVDRNKIRMDETAWFSSEPLRGGSVGNYHMIFRDGVPFQLVAWNNPVDPKAKLLYTGVFLQDSWAINRRLTFNPGIRFARDAGLLPEQCRVTAPAPFSNLYPERCFPEIKFTVWNSIAPRLHAAYLLTDDGKTVIKGGWGRFVDMRTQEDLDLANENAPGSTTFRWTDQNRDRQWQPGESDLNPNGPDFVSRTASTRPGLVNNADLKPAASDELSVTLERELRENFGIRGSYVYARYFNSRRILNLARPYSAYSIPITNADPGPDAILGNSDDPGRTITYYDYPASLRGAAFEQQTYVNDPSVDSNYHSMEVAATKRFSNRWQMMASYSASKVHIPFAANSTTITEVTPNAEIFTTNDTWEWGTRISGSYLFPHDVQVGVNYENRSGEPWARRVSFRGGTQIPSITVNVEPIGAQRTPSVNFVTMNASKSFRLWRGHQATIQGQIINLTNTNEVATFGSGNALAISTLSGSSYGRYTSVAPPRIGEITLRYTF